MKISGFQNAALLGYAVLAYCPIFIGEAGLLGLHENFGEIVGEAEAGVAAGSGCSEQARVFGTEGDGCTGVFGRVEHYVSVGGVERGLEKRAVDGLEKFLGIDSLRFGEDESFTERLNHCADEEVAAEFDGVGLAGF